MHRADSAGNASLPTLDEDSWSLGETGLAAVLAKLVPRAPSTLVEAGSGLSTVHLAAALPDTEIHSLEHLGRFRRRTAGLLETHGVTNVRLHQVGLALRRHGLAAYRTYALPADLPATIDALLIDGPPGVASVGGREAILYGLYDRLPVGGLVILDDAGRPGERRAIEHWRQRYPGAFDVEERAEERGQCYLTKRADIPFRANAGVALRQAIEQLRFWRRRYLPA